MVQRTITIDFEPTTGETTITMAQYADRHTGRVTIREGGDAYLVVGASSRRNSQGFPTLEQAFRVALRAATDQVTEELLG